MAVSRSCHKRPVHAYAGKELPWYFRDQMAKRLPASIPCLRSFAICGNAFVFALVRTRGIEECGWTSQASGGKCHKASKKTTATCARCGSSCRRAPTPSAVLTVAIAPIILPPAQMARMVSDALTMPPSAFTMSFAPDLKSDRPWLTAFQSILPR